MIKELILFIVFHFFVYFFNRDKSKRFFVNCVRSKNHNSSIPSFKSRNKYFCNFYQVFFHRRQSILKIMYIFSNNFSNFKPRYFCIDAFFRKMSDISKDFNNFIFERKNSLIEFLLQNYIIANCFKRFQKNICKNISIIASKRKKIRKI